MDSGKTRGWTGQIDWPPVPPERGKHRKTTSSESWTPVPADGAGRGDPDPFEDTEEFGRATPSWDTEPFWDTEPLTEPAARRAVPAPDEPTDDRLDRVAFGDTTSFDDLVLDHTGAIEAALAPRGRYLASHEDDTLPETGTVPLAESSAHSDGDDARARRSGVWLLAGSSVAALCGLLLVTPASLNHQPQQETPLPGIPHEHAEARPPAAEPPAMPEPLEPSSRSLISGTEPTAETSSAEPSASRPYPAGLPQQQPPRPTEAHEPPLLTEVGGVTARSLRLLSGALSPEERDAADDSAPTLLDLVPPLTSAENATR